MKTILFDAKLCNGCYGCQIACKDEHCGNDWSPIAAEQPIDGQYWCRVVQEERGSIPEVKVQYIPVFCAQCSDAPCMKAAKDDAVYRRDDGLIIIDPEKARGQKQIVDACPSHSIFWNEKLELPQKCTGCAHLLDNGWEVPRCVDVCATGALTYVDEEDVPAEAKPLDSQAPYGAHVMYMNIPKRWVYGCFVDREKNEVLIGADAVLSNAAGEVVQTVQTDEFGEFRFKELDEAVYSVELSAEGYKPATLEADASEKDVVLGDVFAQAAC